MKDTPTCTTCIYYQQGYRSEFGTVIPSDTIALPDCCESYIQKTKDTE